MFHYRFKTFILIVCGVLLAFATPRLYDLRLNPGSLFFIGSLISTALILASYSKIKRIYKDRIIEPIWNDSLKNPNKPLVFIQFLAYLSVTIGLALHVNQLLYRTNFSSLGMGLIGFGIGFYAGIKILLAMQKNDKGKIKHDY